MFFLLTKTKPATELEDEIKDLKLAEGLPLSAHPEIPLPEKLWNPDLRCALIYCFGEDGLVGTVRLYKNVFEWEDGELLVGGIGSLWVKKESRMQGVATLLLETAKKFLEKELCDLILLHTDTTKLSNMFKKFGFQILSQPYKYQSRTGHWYTQINGMILPLSKKTIVTGFLEANNPILLCPPKA